jgi:hypothetical protein
MEKEKFEDRTDNLYISTKRNISSVAKSFQIKFCIMRKLNSQKKVNRHTVKPVYNGHPWDLKNVAVMQRIV